MLEKNQIVELEISGISNDGNGVGRVQGMAVFVPRTAVGDRILARIVRPRPAFAYGIVEKILVPSPDRIASDCAAFRRCGGCGFRHLSYAAELRAKRIFVEDALRRIGGLALEVRETVPSPAQDEYRNKVQFPVCERDGRLTVGLYARRTHEVIPAQDCRLQPELLNRIALAACALLEADGVCAYREESHRGLLRHLFLRCSGKTGQVMLCPVINGDGLPDEAGFVQKITAQFPQVSTVVLNINRARGNVILGRQCRTLWGDGFLRDEICGVPVRLSPRSFFQINTPAAELLYQKAAELAAPGERDVLLDLYCGAGTIGLSIARTRPLAAMIGVEVIPEAVADAGENARQLGLQNCTFFCGDAGEAAARFAAEGRQVNIAVVDPPRKGCDPAALDALLRIRPDRIVMISCNPATLARDLRHLHANGYAPGAVTPVDLFPRTPHVEAVVCLSQQKPDGAGE